MQGKLFNLVGKIIEEKGWKSLLMPGYDGWTTFYLVPQGAGSTQESDEILRERNILPQIRWDGRDFPFNTIEINEEQKAGLFHHAFGSEEPIWLPRDDFLKAVKTISALKEKS